MQLLNNLFKVGWNRKKFWHHLLSADVISFFAARKCLKIKKKMKIDDCNKEMPKNPKNWWKSMKIANINSKDLHIFWMTWKILHYVKSVQKRSFVWSVLPAFGQNTDRYSVSLRIQSKCGKIRTRKNSVFGHFSRNGNKSFRKDMTYVEIKSQEKAGF